MKKLVVLDWLLIAASIVVQQLLLLEALEVMVMRAGLKTVCIVIDFVVATMDKIINAPQQS